MVAQTGFNTPRAPRDSCTITSCNSNTTRSVHVWEEAKRTQWRAYCRVRLPAEETLHTEYNYTAGTDAVTLWVKERRRDPAKAIVQQ